MTDCDKFLTELENYMIFKLSMIAAVLVSVSAHAEIKCERSKLELDLNGQHRIERLVKIVVDGETIYSENFDQALELRNAAADACKLAIAKTSCGEVQVAAREGFTVSSGDKYGRQEIPAIRAHTGYSSSVNGITYDNRRDCEVSLADAGEIVIHSAKKEYSRQTRAEYNRQRLERQMKSGPYL
jgi:hypothetical protein